MASRLAPQGQQKDLEKSKHIKITDLFSKVLIGDLDITDVDWNNPDVIRLFGHMKSRIEKVEKDNEHLQKDNAQMQKDYQYLQKENEQMQKDNAQMQKDNLHLQKENEQLKTLLGQQSPAAGSGVGERRHAKGVPQEVKLSQL